MEAALFWPFHLHHKDKRTKVARLIKWQKSFVKVLLATVYDQPVL